MQEGIDAFPKHVVPILTSAVIECHRAALHGPAQVGWQLEALLAWGAALPCKTQCGGGVMLGLRCGLVQPEQQQVGCRSTLPNPRFPPCHAVLLQRWAAVLMEPGFVGQVSPAFAKKIEAIAKQPAWCVGGGTGWTTVMACVQGAAKPLRVPAWGQCLATQDLAAQLPLLL